MTLQRPCIIYRTHQISHSLPFTLCCRLLGPRLVCPFFESIRYPVKSSEHESSKPCTILHLNPAPCRYPINPSPISFTIDQATKLLCSPPISNRSDQLQLPAQALTNPHHNIPQLWFDRRVWRRAITLHEPIRAIFCYHNLLSVM